MASFFIDRPVTTGCLTILVATFCLNFVIADCTNTLALVIVNTLIADKQIWNIVTCQFYEKSIIKLLFDLAGILIITKSTRIIGGYKQFGLFFAVSLFCCSFFTTVYCFIRFFSTGIEDMIMEPIYGFAGVFMIMLTYGRQQLQNEPVFVQLPSINYNNLPLIVVSVQLILWLVGLKILALDLPFSIIAMLVSWSYLRFYYKFETNSTTFGDRSDSFAFVAMFPEVRDFITAPILIAGSRCGNLISLLRDRLLPKIIPVILRPHLDLLLYFASGLAPYSDSYVDSIL